jgi:quercetin dioxygenase-like cupin family protein
VTNYIVKNASEHGYINAMDGIRRKTLVYGDHMLLTEFKLGGDKTLPMHRHPQEQTGYLVSGHIILTIDGNPHDVKPGDSWSIPGNIDHGAQVIEDSVAIEVFSPVRDDYKTVS